MRVTTNSSVAAFSMVRMSSTTHTVNNDQRRVPLSFVAAGNNAWELDIPSNPGILLPGYWMLFAMDAKGTPSVAKIIRVDASGAPRLEPVDDQTSGVGTSAWIDVNASAPGSAPVSFGAKGLPSGVSINASTGRIAGAPSAVGTYKVTVAATAGGQTSSTTFRWSVRAPASTRYVKLEALSEIHDGERATMAEFNVLDRNGRTISRSGWTTSASSSETDGEAASAAKAVDGDASTYWSSAWRGTPAAMPHAFVVDLGAGHDIGGFRYLPRAGSTAGHVARYRFYVSENGVNWGLPVAEGDFSEFESGASEKTVYIGNVARGKTAQQSSSPSSGTANLAVDGVVAGDFNLGSVAHTDSEPNEWWEVDLGESHQLHAVRLWNRTDCCSERLHDVVVMLSEKPMAGRSFATLRADPAVTQVSVPGPVQRSATIALSGRGRYLRVQLAGVDFLQLAEVEAFGVKAVNNAPTIVTPAPASVLQGQSTRLALSARDGDGDQLSFSASGLPNGLSINAQSGVISGTATHTGAFTVSAKASDPSGASATASFTWTVRSPTPVINTITVTSASSGSTVNYAPSVTGGGTYQYRWNFGDGSATTAYSNSSSTSHRFASAGVYGVTLTVRASDGTSVTRSFLQAVATPALPVAPRASSKLAVEWRKGSDARLWSVNPDNNSVTVFDVTGKRRLAEVAVGIQPSTLAFAPDGRLWVANTGSATLSVIDVITQRVVKTIMLARASQPYGLIFSPVDGNAFVALQATGQVVKLSSTGSILAIRSVGPNPRHLSISGTGGRVYVSRFITPSMPGEATATVKSVDSAGIAKGGEVLVLSPSTLAISRTVVLAYSNKPDTTVSGRGVPNYLGPAVIAPDGKTAWVPGKQDNIARGALRDKRGLDFQNTVRAISSRLNLSTLLEDAGARIDHDNAGLASAAAFHPSGAYLFVALETSRQVAVIDAARQRELFRVDTGRAPQGLLVSPDGKTLFVHDYMDRRVSFFDLTPLVQRGESRITRTASVAGVVTDKLSATVLKGKQLFYDARDPRLARDGYMSCASCHSDAGHDGRTWDLTGFGEGLRNTTSLRGRANAHGNLHWSANFDEAQDFEGQIRNLAGGTGLMSNTDFNYGTRSQPLGTKKAGRSVDLDALAAYLASLKTFEASPLRTSTGALSSAALAGRAVFIQMNCASCHGGSRFTNSAAALSNIGTLKSSSGKRLNGTLSGIDVPTLRDVWNTAPYLHDGSAPTLADAVRAHKTLGISSADASSVAAYLREIGSEETTAPAPTPASGKGLLGEYFVGTSLSGTPKLRRAEAINFSWTGSPGGSVPSDNFSVRWSGTLEAPSTGAYYLRTRSNAGVRVWLNDVKVIDHWTAHVTSYDTSSAINLTAGRRYRIRLEYFDTTGAAIARLDWRLPGATSYVLVPANRLYQ